jgi:hypothetical protein
MGAGKALTCAVEEVIEADEALIQSDGNEDRLERLRCETRGRGEPVGKRKNWRCERLSFAYFSLPLCTDWRHG